MTPTQRTLAAMREQGRVCGIVEKFNSFVGPYGIRQDLFGFIDVIAIDPAQGIVAVQSCGQDWSGHVAKMLGERNENMFAWIKHAPIELWAWRKVKLKREGVFTAKARRAGMGVQAYARKVLAAPDGRFSLTTRKQANFAKNAKRWK